MILPLDQIERPESGFSCVLADPPWTHRTRSPKGGSSRHPSRHYPTMALDDIMALPVSAVAARDAHLFLWTTWPHLEEALQVMRSWGFRYSSGFLTWVKLNPRASTKIFLTEADFHMGTGYVSRKNTEPLLLGRRGNPKILSAPRELVIASRREHSRKPDQSIARIEQFCPGPRLELFSRQARPGWAAWGLEAGKFDDPGQVAA